MKNEKMIIIDKTGHTRYDCKYKDGEFYMPIKAIKEMQKKMTYDEAVLYFFNTTMEVHQLKEKIDKAIEYIKKESIDNKEYRDIAYIEALNNVLDILKGEE